MNVLIALKSICLISIMMVHCRAEDYTVGEIETEKLFRNFHPDTKKIIWPGLETLAPETLKRICDEVLDQLCENELTGFIKEYKYTPVNASDLQTTRVLRDVRFFSFLKAELQKLTLVACVYDKITFYLVRADDNNVFRVWKDGAGIFALKSGLHPVHFN